MSKTGYFFDTEADFKKQLPVNISLSISDLQQRLKDAAERYLRPKIGDLLDNALIAYQAETGHGLINSIQRCIANFALYHQLPLTEVQISDSGVMRIETENEKTAYKYQTDALKAEILNSGFTAIEYTLGKMEAQKGNPDYEWYFENALSTRNSNTEMLLWNSIEFNRFNRLAAPAATFDFLVPSIQAVEDFVIRAYIGDAYFNELLNEKRAGTLTAENSSALLLIAKATTNFVIEFAAKAGSGKATRDGFKIIQTANENTSTISASNDQIRLTTNFSNMTGFMYISRLLRLLAIDELYETYKTFAATETVTATKNDGAIYRF
jgi:hypothetical protein